MSVLSSLQSRAATQFLDVGYPTQKQEAWRYMDLSAFHANVFGVDAASHSPEAQFSHPEASGFAILNNRPSAVNKATLPKAVTLAWFTDLTPDEQLEMMAFLPEIKDEKNPFSLLNLAHFSEMMVIRVPRNCRLESPIHVAINTAFLESTQTYPRLFISLETDASADVLITMEDQSSASVCQNLVIDCHLAESASLSLGLVGVDTEKGYRFNQLRASLESDSVFKSTLLSRGSEQTRHDIQITFKGERAHSELSGLALLSGKSQVFTHTRVNHFPENTTSTQLFKNVLTETTRSEYNGLVYVHRGAQLTNSTQHNHNLLLSDDARAYSRPQLEIYADDVKCAHGANIGQLNEQELFYLQSRGLSLSEARSILLYGFVEEVIEKFPEGPLRNALSLWVKDVLGSLKAVTHV